MPLGLSGIEDADLAVTPDGDSLYAALNLATSGAVAQFDVGSGGLLSPKSTAIVPGPPSASAIGVAPDGQSAYVAGNSLYQYEVGAGGGLSPKSPASLPFPASNPEFFADGLATSPDGRSVYVVVSNAFGDALLLQYDVGPGGALAPKSPPTLELDFYAGGLAVSPDSRSVYVALASGPVAQYDADADGALSRKNPPSVAAAAALDGMAVSEDGRTVWVASNANTRTAGSVAKFVVGAEGTLSPLKNPPTVPAGTFPSGLVRSPAIPTAGADVLTGTARRNVICGLGGSDVIRGLQGNDFLSGDRCRARTSVAAAARAGADRVFGGRGRDRLFGGGGRDRLHGGPGKDTIVVRGGGRDVVRCGRGRDRVRADKRDRLRGCERIRR